MLNRLQIWIPDINEKNFLAGGIVGLLSAYVLPDLTRPEFYDVKYQCPLVKLAVLRHHGYSRRSFNLQLTTTIKSGTSSLRSLRKIPLYSPKRYMST
jgi:hypothetical protein